MAWYLYRQKELPLLFHIRDASRNRNNFDPSALLQKPLLTLTTVTFRVSEIHIFSKSLSFYLSPDNIWPSLLDIRDSPVFVSFEPNIRIQNNLREIKER